MPPPPAWLVRAVHGLSALCALTVPFQVYNLMRLTDVGRAALAGGASLGRDLWAHAGDLTGAFLALVVVPAVIIYVMLRAMVDITDWLDLTTHKWRAERFRKCGW